MGKNPVGWFEIPVEDMERAKGFYEAVFGMEMQVHDLGGLIMGWFPGNHSRPGATGSLVKHELYRPSATEGALVYFTCDNLSRELERVEEAGGSIQKPKTEIGGGHGFMALILDTEGNRIALHSLK